MGIDTLHEWINEQLIRWGIISNNDSVIDNLVVLLLIIAGAFIIDFIFRNIGLKLFKSFARKTKNGWDDIIVDRKIINKLINIVPAIIIYILLPLVFTPEESPVTLDWLRRLCMVYIIGVSLRFIVSSLGVVHDFMVHRAKDKNKPLKGFVQILQVAVIFIGIILIIAVLVKESPTRLLAGLGASAAILMLIFKDTILGFVAGIQLSINDMLRAGDWITMNKYNADGVVTEVTLYAVRVRNWDNTITTIPPYALISDSFQNWRGMFDSGGRRIKRSINIDMNSVRFCTPEMLERFRKISLLADYIDGKEEELLEYNEENHIDSSVLVNGRRQTNLGVFRAYLVRYLRNNPKINQELMLVVRHLQPTETGIPIELYFFSSDRNFVAYEELQADVFDHVLAIVSEFDLHVFQSVSGYDLQRLSLKDLLKEPPSSPS